MGKSLQVRRVVWGLPLLLWSMGGRAAWGQAPAPPPALPPLAAPPAATAPPVVPSPPAPALPAPVPPPTPAFFVPRIAFHLETSTGGQTYAVLTINETEAATIRADAGGYSPAQRAAVAVQRLTTLLQDGLRPDEIAAQPDAKPQWEVAARGGPLLMATPEEATAHQKTPKLLAQDWVRALRQLLSQPPLTLSERTLVVPFGETRAVMIGGAVLPTDVRVQDDDHAVGVSQFNPATRLLTVQGHATGRDLVTIAPAPGIGGVPLTLPVTVMHYAGEAAPTISIQVTGDPAPPDLLRQAAYLGLVQALQLEDGAQVALNGVPSLTAPLPVGKQATAAFPLHLLGSDLLPVTARPIVTIVNAAIPPQTPSELFYSNSPEQVTRAQTLFTGHLHPAATIRLDFHHQNRSGQLLTFHIDLMNNSAVPASIQMIAGLSLPGADTVQVGRRAGADFLANLNTNTGLVLTVPPHGTLPLVTQRFAPGLTLSGLLQLHSLSGGELTLSVRAAEDTDTLASPLWRIYMAGDNGNALAAPTETASLDETAASSPAIFPHPHVILTGRYVIGGRWAFVTLGDQDALHARAGGLRLFGNYGADYDIALTLINPTPDTRTVGIFFAPGAGLTAGVFQVDNGPIQQFDPFEPPDERQLDQVTLAPGQTQTVHLHTIPLNGSSYPVQIIARAQDKPPVPSAPPSPPAAAAPAVAVTAVTVGKAGH